MAHYKKGNEPFSLRPNTELIAKLKEIAKKSGAPTHNQLALDLIAGGLEILAQSGEKIYLPAVYQYHRERLHKKPHHPDFFAPSGIREEVARLVQSNLEKKLEEFAQQIEIQLHQKKQEKLNLRSKNP